MFDDFDAIGNGGVVRFLFVMADQIYGVSGLDRKYDPLPRRRCTRIAGEEGKKDCM